MIENKILETEIINNINYNFNNLTIKELYRDIHSDLFDILYNSLRTNLHREVSSDLELTISLELLKINIRT